MSLDFETNVAPSTTVHEKKEITLGRSQDNDVVLDLPEVSAQHAKLIAKLDDETGEPQLYVTDLGSSNGTLVENNTIEESTEVAIHPHQRIKIGRFLIKPFLNTDDFEKTIEITLTSLKDEKSSEEKSRDIPSRTSIFTYGDDSLGSEDSDKEEMNTDLEVNVKEEIEDMSTTEPSVEQPESAPIEEQIDEQLSASDALEDHEHLNGSYEPAHSLVSEPINAAESVDLDTSAITGNLDSDIEHLDFVALELLSVEGTITHKGSPLADVSIDAGDLGTTTTDSSGKFSFTNVPETTNYSISISKENYRFSEDTLTGEAGANLALDISATRLYSIAGQVIHRGQPLSGATIDGESLGSVVTDEEGRYTFSDVPEDTTYTLTASKDGFLIGRQTITK
jgi:pSer/pThr/pTyr-binding forkhead associated (FHA) protein